MNPLMVVMSVRDFKIVWRWIDKIDFLDKLVIKYFTHDKAHEIAKEFFMRHREYSHMLVYAEDILATPCHVKMLIKDAESRDFDVISGYSNFDLKRKWLAFSLKNLSKTKIISANQYGFPTIDYILTDKFNDVYLRVFFVGLPLTLIKRSVLEKVSFRPYKYIIDYALGKKLKRGIMFDLQFAIECYKLGIPIYIDKRVFVIHFGDTRKYINLKYKTPWIGFQKAHSNEMQVYTYEKWKKEKI